MTKTKAPTAQLEGELVTLHVDTIKPYWRNPRFNEQSVEAVVHSIERYGYNQPIVVDSDHTIIVGHTRYKAIRQLGYEQVPVLVRDLPPDRAQEYRIADNKSGEIAEWDYGNLIQELREIDDPDAMQPFFPDLDLTDFLSDTAGGDTGFTPPSQEDVDRTTDEHGSRFTDRNADKVSGYVDITCPECGEDFQIHRDDVTRRTSGGFTATEVVMPDDAQGVFEQAAERVKERLAEDGLKPHGDPAVWRGQVLEALAADYLAGS